MTQTEKVYTIAIYYIGSGKKPIVIQLAMLNEEFKITMQGTIASWHSVK